jgi:hypothetical protein
MGDGREGIRESSGRTDQSEVYSQREYFKKPL